MQEVVAENRCTTSIAREMTMRILQLLHLPPKPQAGAPHSPRQKGGNPSHAGKCSGRWRINSCQFHQSSRLGKRPNRIDLSTKKYLSSLESNRYVTGTLNNFYFVYRMANTTSQKKKNPNKKNKQVLLCSLLLNPAVKVINVTGITKINLINVIQLKAQSF